MKHAVVVGAGIGGVTAASALGRSGWQVTLLERAPELGEVGSGISVWPAAMRVLDGLGVADELRADTVLAGQAGLRRPDGRWLVSVEGSRIEIPAMVHRARLHESILDSVPDSAEIRTGVTVTGVDPAGNLSTSTGERISADLVVAADGIRSVVRRTLHPAQAAPRYAGYTAFRGIAPAGSAVSGSETWGRGRRFGFVPMVDGRVYWYATANVPAGDTAADVRALFGDWHDPVPALLAATPPETVLRNDLYDLRLPLGPFGTRRVALLGDAAHAMTPNLGQGACAAIEDAAALAALVSEYDEVPAALAAYDRQRRKPTARLVRRSRLMGDLGQLENPVALASRDAVLRLAGGLAGLLARRGKPVRAGVGESGP
jgi:2-polyprenyl-6-methoxyphenol hydroxylase-like FAD-dependent oxidoreductase